MYASMRDPVKWKYLHGLNWLTFDKKMHNDCALLWVSRCNHIGRDRGLLPPKNSIGSEQIATTCGTNDIWLSLDKFYWPY